MPYNNEIIGVVGMKRVIFLILLIVFLAGFVSADEFIHEGDHNYSVHSVAMTTEPYLNGNLILNFNLIDETGSAADNIHAHISVFDDRNALVSDYSIKNSGENYKNLPAVENSTGYNFFRFLDKTQTASEYRIVSDDNGFISVILFLPGCGPNQVKDCYFQNAIYHVQIKQQGLEENNDFSVRGQKIQVNWVYAITSMIANNFSEL